MNIWLLTWPYVSVCSRRDIRGPRERLWKVHSKRSTMQDSPVEQPDGESEPDHPPGLEEVGPRVRVRGHLPG